MIDFGFAGWMAGNSKASPFSIMILFLGSPYFYLKMH